MSLKPYEIVIEDFLSYTRDNPVSIQGGFHGLMVAPYSYLSLAVVRSDSKNYFLSRSRPLSFSARSVQVWPSMRLVTPTINALEHNGYKADSLILWTFPTPQCLWENLQTYRQYVARAGITYQETRYLTGSNMHNLVIPAQELETISVAFEPVSPDTFAAPGSYSVVITVDGETQVSRVLTNQLLNGERIVLNGAMYVNVVLDFVGGGPSFITTEMTLQGI